ncbi:hypothetical protein K439DRAFT_457160 [Ramaria rubella]|nr:hypothetical protein K439DRAFT_457160 [Ramaria rubella]
MWGCVFWKCMILYNYKVCLSKKIIRNTVSDSSYWFSKSMPVLSCLFLQFFYLLKCLDWLRLCN